MMPTIHSVLFTGLLLIPLIGIHPKEARACLDLRCWNSYEDCLPLAQEGDPVWQVELADILVRGHAVATSYNKVDIDYKKALYWYEKAAEQNYAPAMYKAGQLYVQGGRGMKVNYFKAAEYYLKAAKLGHREAQQELAKLYKKGKGVDKDLVQAIAWSTTASYNTGVYHEKYILLQIRSAKKRLKIFYAHPKTNHLAKQLATEFLGKYLNPQQDFYSFKGGNIVGAKIKRIKDEEEPFC
jgi:TPR repeat protein